MTTPLFHPTLTDPTDRGHLAPLQILLEWLTRVDQWHLRRSLRRQEKGLSQTVIPPLYAARVAYRPRGTGRQDWLDAPAVLQQGGGDAEDLVAWRCAELRLTGVDAEPVVAQEWEDGRWVVACYVRRPDGRIEDPARSLNGGRPPARRSAPDPESVKPLVHLSLPDSDDDAHFAPLQLALEGLTHIDEFQIRRSLSRLENGLSDTVLPPLYASGVYYREEEPGHEDWLDTPAVLRQGYADCEDLAAWRCAELRVAGIDAEPVIKYQWIPREMMIQQGWPPDKLPTRGVWLVHCCVRWPDGRVEDPSKILGMGGTFMERI